MHDLRLQPDELVGGRLPHTTTLPIRAGDVLALGGQCSCASFAICAISLWGIASEATATPSLVRRAGCGWARLDGDWPYGSACSFACNCQGLTNTGVKNPNRPAFDPVVMLQGERVMQDAGSGARTRKSLKDKGF